MNSRLSFSRGGLVVLLGAALCAAPAAAQVTNFSQDVSTSIDRGLAWLDAQGVFQNPSTAGDAAGLTALALLEKRQSADPDAPPQGYVNATPGDQARLDRIFDFILARAPAAGFYAYRDGGDLMALSVYLRTGGPRMVEARNAINAIFDRIAANQGAHGYWCYVNGGCLDSSTTQLVMAGLAAAKGVYSDPVFADPARLGTLNARVATTRAAYAANGTSDGLEAAERGHGYNVGHVNSYQQTASGLWGQIIGGADLNDASVQGYLRWLRNRYNYQTTNNANGGWSQSYYYYLWSSAKAFTFIEDSGVAPAPGNLGTADLGVLAAGDPPAFAGRLLRLDPTTAARVPSFGPEGAGYYNDAAEPSRWYFDYAYTILGLQAAGGLYEMPAGHGRWFDAGTYADQAYALLVLQRSVGGGCADTDDDHVCDNEDNCPAVSNPGQSDRDGDGRGDVCEACPDDASKTEPGLCGCGVSDADSDGDGTVDCRDFCPDDPNKIVPGICDCGKADTDGDADGTADCLDDCPDDPAKSAPGQCGCGVADDDADSDGAADCVDACPADAGKIDPGVCGCGEPEVPGCGDDECPDDPNKTEPGICGCGVSDADSDGDGTVDCHDGCPNDPNKLQPMACGCGQADVDSDGDGVLDCRDQCPRDRTKVEPGQCGCGQADKDLDHDDIADCRDNCPEVPNFDQLDGDADGRGDVCDDECDHTWPYPNEVSVAEAYNRLYCTAFDTTGMCGLDALHKAHGVVMHPHWTTDDIVSIQVLAIDTSSTDVLRLRVLDPAGEGLYDLLDPGPWTPDSRGWLPGGGAFIDLEALLAANGHPADAPFQFLVGDDAMDAGNTLHIAGGEPGESLLAYNGGGVGGGDGDHNEPVFLAQAPLSRRLAACPAGYRVVVGTDGDDVLVGTGLNECMYGLGGNDLIRGRNGNDMIWGGRGDDDVRGENNDDYTDGGSCHDKSRGGLGNDTVLGGAGDDFVDGSEGDDVLEGGDGDDSLYAYGGNDLLRGGAGDDYLLAGPGNDVLEGDVGDDELYGQDGDDALDGGDGNDKLRGDNHNDWLSGGRGDDNLGAGNGDDVLEGGDGADSMVGGAGHDLISGGEGADRANGNEGNDVMNGDGGDDVFAGDAGDDRLDGGAGRDLVYGGDGTDVCIAERKRTCEL